MNINFIIFDAKTKTYTNRKAYSYFVKKIKSYGYVKIQNSFYSKIFDNNEKSQNSIIKIKAIVPKSIVVSIFSITEEKYNKIESINYSLPKIDKSSIICI